MREIVLDTETTGFEPDQGDRLVEIGAIELINHMPTGRTFHKYINPQRDMPQSAFEVHGIGPDLLSPPQEPKPGQVILRDKPLFSAVGAAFLEFIGDARLVIHNAAFDMKFLNAELGWIGLPAIPMDRAVDTLDMARRKFPGSPASLDALCRRFNIDASARTLHGALLDSEILAEVYLELRGGRQPGLILSSGQTTQEKGTGTGEWRPTKRPTPLPSRLTEQERQDHKAFTAGLGANPIWDRYAD